jgi:hypothetical protein
MFHYFDTLTNTRGDSLTGYYVRLRTFDGQQGSPVTIYADESGTAIQFTSGVAGQARTDGTGFFDFWVDDGTYTLEVLNPAGSLVRTIRGVPMRVSAGSGGVSDDEGIWNANSDIIDNEGIWS